MNYELGIMKLGQNLHHAYTISGGASEVRHELFKFLEKSWGVDVKGNPDFHYLKFETLNVEEARKFKGLGENKSFTSDGKKVFVIEANAINVEAQNSLLKMFEEPTPDTYFFLIGNCVKSLLPTLASRVSRIDIEKAPSRAGARDGAEDFLASGRAERLALVKDLADDIKDEKKTKTDAVELVNRIEEILYQKSNKEGKLPSQILQDIEMCREYLGDRSAGVKMLLEYVAIVAPKI